MDDELYVVWVAVYPPPHPSAEALRALGAAIAAFAASEPRVSVGGADELLAGRYPRPHDTYPVVPDTDGDIEGPLGVGRFSIPEPWRYCAALFRARPSDVSEAELISALRQAIPPALGKVAPAYVCA